MNEILKKQVNDASYAFYNNSIYKIVKVTTKLNKLIMCECDISHKIKIDDKEHIYYESILTQFKTVTLILKEYKKAIFYNTFNKCIIYENNKYILSDIINTLETHDALCEICYEVKPATPSLYKCHHNNICVECSINWNKDFLNSCPLCRADNNFIKLIENKFKNTCCITDGKLKIK